MLVGRKLNRKSITQVWFVVLHYQNVDVTSRCIDSLLRLEVPKGLERTIIVVDNGSPNGSGTDLISLYGSTPGVQVILSVENLGFARGNNLGYAEVRGKCDWDSSVVVVLNNDTEIAQRDFIAVMCSEFENGSIDALAVDVYNPIDDKHQSPLCEGGQLVHYAEREAENARKAAEVSGAAKIVAIGRNAIGSFLRSIPLVGSFARDYHIKKGRNSDWRHSRTDVVPHGSCVIAGPSFIRINNEFFDGSTFMYLEECLFKLKCDSEGISIYYTPKLQVLHLHGEYRAGFDFGSFARYQRAAKWLLESYEIFKSRLASMEVSDENK